MSNWQPILDDIQKELTLACEKFPGWPTDPIHAAAIIAEESEELIQATLELTYEPEKCTWEHMRSEAIQTAAMAIRFIAGMESYQYRVAKR